MIVKLQGKDNICQIERDENGAAHYFITKRVMIDESETIAIFLNQ